MDDGRLGAETGVIVLAVEPSDAELFVDGEYRGRIDRWVHQRVPVAPGHHRVEIRRKGYVSERFDLVVGAYEELSLSLSMVREGALADDREASKGNRLDEALESSHGQ